MEIIKGKSISTKHNSSDEIKPRFNMNDLSGVYTHYDAKLKKNVPTENTLKGDENSGES